MDILDAIKRMFGRKQKMYVVNARVAPFMAVHAVLMQGKLLLVDPKPYSQDVGKLVREVATDIHDMGAKGFLTAIEEVSPGISQMAGARHVRLDSSCPKLEIPVLCAAYEHYLELKARKAISFPSPGGEMFEVPESIVNVRYGNKGERSFEIDWNSVTSQHRLTLLACYLHSVGGLTDLAAWEEFTATASDLNASAQQQGYMGNNEYARGFNAIQTSDRRAAEAASKSMAGTIINEHSRIL